MTRESRLQSIRATRVLGRGRPAIRPASAHPAPAIVTPSEHVQHVSAPANAPLPAPQVSRSKSQGDANRSSGRVHEVQSLPQSDNCQSVGPIGATSSKAKTPSPSEGFVPPAISSSSNHPVDTTPAPDASMSPDRASEIHERWEEMKHQADVWKDESFADVSLHELRESYQNYLEGREKPASPDTIDKYLDTLIGFEKSLEKHGDPLTLASLTPGAVRRWIAEQRRNGQSEHGIAGRLSGLKAFSNKFVFKASELTTRDLLEKVERLEPKVDSYPELTEEQQNRILDCYDRGTYEDVRNRALMAFLLATGARFGAVITLDNSNFNRVTGAAKLHEKGNEWHLVQLSFNALKIVRAYLKIRPEPKGTNGFWLKEDGTTLTYWGGQSVFRRLKDRAGMQDLHAHLMRHNFGKKALRNGATVAEVQDMLHHKTRLITKRYVGDVADEVSAKNTAKYSPL